MNRLSIRWQFTLWFGATLAVMIFGFSLLLFAVMRHQLLAAVDAGLRRSCAKSPTKSALRGSFPRCWNKHRNGFSSTASITFKWPMRPGA